MHPGQSRVDAEQAPLGSALEDAFHGVFEDAVVFRLGLLQGLFRLLALSDVLNYRQLGQGSVRMTNKSVNHMIPAVVSGAEYFPAYLFSPKDSFINAPGADILQVVQGLVAFLSKGIIAGPLNEALVHKFHFIILRADIDEAIEGFQDSFILGP